MEYDDADFYSGRKQGNYVSFYNVEVTTVNGDPLIRPYILIVSPGQSRSEFRGPVQEKHKREYPEQWKAFQDRKDSPQLGTPIEQMLGISEDRVKVLKVVHVHTIEQLAEVSDGNLQNLGMGATMLREQARNWVKSHGPEMSAMGKAMQEMTARLDALQKENEKLRKGDFSEPAAETVNVGPAQFPDLDEEAA